MNPHRLSYTVLLTKAILLAVSANAASVHLLCKATSTNRPAHQVTIDERRQTVTFGEDDPSLANFSETKIKWFGTFAVYPNFSDYAASFLLDRVTGVLTVSYESPNNSREADFECTATGRKF
jgi:hypothetical protein